MSDKCWHTSRDSLLADLANKWIIFDTSAINRLIENGAEDFWLELDKHSIIPCSLDLIILELLAHGDPTERTRRLEAVAKLSPLSLLPDDSETARRLQNELHAVNSKECSPSPTDLYIGAVASRFSHDTLLIATENATDFPKPYFERVGYILLEDKLRVRAICILRVSAATEGRVRPKSTITQGKP